MFSYAAYGLGIRSVLPLPELIVDEERAADIIIRLGEIDDAPENSARASFHPFDPKTIYVRSKDAGKFALKDGCEVIIDPIPGVDESVLRLFILGPVLAFLIYQRGMLVLHASAVAVTGGAVAFMGHSGWGKSTIAAALHVRGHSVVADDVLAVQMDAEHQSIVWPGFPQLKLWPEVAGSLGGMPEDLPRLHHSIEKRARRAIEGFSPAPLPLKRLYVLAESESYQVELLPPQEAIIELVRHSYGVRLFSTQPEGAHFSRCADLAKRLPVHRLHRPRALAELATLAQLVERDITSAAPKPI